MGYSETLQHKLDELTKLQQENRKLLQEIKGSITNKSTAKIITSVKPEDLYYLLSDGRITGTGDDFEKEY